MPDTFRTAVQFEPTPGFVVSEEEFDRFSEAAYDVEASVPEVVECHVRADLAAQVVVVEILVTAEDEQAARLNVDWIAEGLAHRVDVLAGRATTVGTAATAERLTPA